MEVRKYIKTDINKLQCCAELNYLVHVETPVDVRLFSVGDVELKLFQVYIVSELRGAYCCRRFRCLYFRISTDVICFPPTPVPSN